MRCSVAMALLALSSSSAAAQCMDLMSIPASASTRALAMGDANVAGGDDDVIFYNPAQLARARGTSAAVERYGPQRRGGTIATTERLGNGGFGVGATLGTSRNLPCGTDVPPYNLAPVSGHRLVAVAGAAQTWKHTQFGIAARYVEEQYGSGTASAPLLDAGIGRDFRVFDRASVAVGAAVQNIGNGDRRHEVPNTPLSTTLGAFGTMPLGPLDLAFAGEVGMPWWNDRLRSHSRDLRTGGGLEAGYSWLDGYAVALRAGLRRADHWFGIGNWTGGAGLTLDRVAVDYAFEQVEWPTRGIAHRVGLRVR